MTEKKQGRRSAEDAHKTRIHIQKIATLLFCQFGYSRVSLRQISEKAGISHSLIRHHFGSKEQIWYSISDGLHQYLASYMRIVIEKLPESSPPNVKLYQFSVRMLAFTLVKPQPIQLIADAVRQEEMLFDYFIDHAGELETLIGSLAQRYNEQHPEQPIKIWEIKWQMIMFAHGAASLSPFMRETWADETDDMAVCLLKHWNLFNQHMATTFQIPETQRLNPASIAELVHDFDYDCDSCCDLTLPD
jgi:AcrR family transcriptional regulator